ncbi:MAG: protein kinase domain-containing protein [Acutalibacteraceae bacterium]
MDKYDSFIGKVLDGRYKILEMLGVGGMAFVLKAEDLMMNRIVAIKILNDQYNGDEQAETRFINESKAVAMLSHKNIVSVYDVAIYPDMKYIVMEYLDGITLKEYLDKKGALPWKEACIYIGQVLRALEHAHSKGVIHRDIKPQNIILQKNGEIKVTDFGIAKLPNDSSLTTTEKAIGTVYYISPEQASGKETSFSSDIYSVGVMLYEALTGRLPFVADSPVTIALMQINDQPTPPEEINDQIPLGVSQIVMKAMQKDTAARFATAHGMVKALDCVLRDPEVVFTDNAIAAENSKDNKLVNINLIATGELGEFKLEPEDGQKPEEKPKPPKKKRRIREEQSRSLFPIITGVFLAFSPSPAWSPIWVISGCPAFEPAPDDSFYVRTSSAGFTTTSWRRHARKQIQRYAQGRL